MDTQPIRVSSEETSAAEDDRFHRFRLIGWWDQEKLSRARVLVVGAGALGNELLKNLALLGVGNILVADLDTIENSNLSRSILYREKDNGKSKAETAATAAKEIYPDLNVHFFHGNVVHDLGLGVYRWADVVLGGLDNREARLSINRNCWKVGRTWIDGAIEQIQGIARVFQPDGPCYECTMSDVDWQLLQNRRSCNLLTRQEMQGGRTPTTPTISSIIAGVQCQEAVKHLHEMETLAGRGWVMDGLSSDAYTIEYQRKEDCYSHEMLDDVIAIDEGVSEITAGDLLQRARQRLGDDVELELARDVVARLNCPACQQSEDMFRSLSAVTHADALCPHCQDSNREVETFFKIRGDESFLNSTLESIGVPPLDIVFARSPTKLVGFELSGDAAQVLGPLAGNEDALEWE